MTPIGFNVNTTPEMPSFFYPVPMTTQIQWASENRINKFYPSYRQEAILNSGVQADIDRMNNFLAAILDWTISDNPTSSALKLIVP